MRTRIKAGGHASPTACASNYQSQYSVKSNRHAASASSVAWIRKVRRGYEMLLGGEADSSDEHKVGGNWGERYRSH
jgi:hypothetical protein